MPSGIAWNELKSTSTENGPTLNSVKLLRSHSFSANSSVWDIEICLFTRIWEKTFPQIYWKWMQIVALNPVESLKRSTLLLHFTWQAAQSIGYYNFRMSNGCGTFLSTWIWTQWRLGRSHILNISTGWRLCRPSVISLQYWHLQMLNSWRFLLL